MNYYEVCHYAAGYLFDQFFHLYIHIKIVLQYVAQFTICVMIYE
jgi:hypothetical protein